jgi:hypothetical protein
LPAATGIVATTKNVSDLQTTIANNYIPKSSVSMTSTDNAIVRFDGTACAVQDSKSTIDDNGYITTPRL